MTLGRKIIQISLVALSLTCFAKGGIVLHYASPMGGDKWKMTGNRLRCGLSLMIPQYGIAYFEQYATQNPHFILRKWDEEQRNLPANVYAVPPVWKPDNKVNFISGTRIKPGKYGIYLERENALKSLIYLSRGYQTLFRYRSQQGFEVDVALSPISFQSAYNKYQRCLGNLLSFNYNDVKVTLIYFGEDSFDLSDQDKEMISKIAEYVKADSSIVKIKIIGYTDGDGRSGYNNAISEYRAKAVASYLMQGGINKRYLSVTWKGEKDPVARNDTDEGKAKNRRVLIVLRRK